MKCIDNVIVLLGPKIIIQKDLSSVKRIVCLLLTNVYNFKYLRGADC